MLGLLENVPVEGCTKVLVPGSARHAYKRTKRVVKQVARMIRSKA